MLRVLGLNPGRDVVSPLSLASSPSTHPLLPLMNSFIATVSTDLSFAKMPCMFFEFISSLPVVFSICYLVSLSYTCNLVIVSMIILLSFFSAYKLCSYNKQYEKMWHLLCAVFFQKVLYGYFFVSGKLWAKKSSNATIKGYFSWCPKERQKQAELVGLKWRLSSAECRAWKGWMPCLCSIHPLFSMHHWGLRTSSYQQGPCMSCPRPASSSS